MPAFVADGLTFNTTTGTHTVTLTPGVGELIIIISANTGFTALTAPTDDNSSGTYTRIATAYKAANADTMSIFARTSLIPSTASTVFTHAPGTSSGGGLTVIEISGVSYKKTGASAAKQAVAVQSNQDPTITPTPTFTYFPNPANMIIGATFNATTGAGMTARTGYTERRDVNYATPSTGLETMTRDSGEAMKAIAWGGTIAFDSCSLALELDSEADVDVINVSNQNDPKTPQRYWKPA